MAGPKLFQPIQLRDIGLKNRVVVAPMQYSQILWAVLYGYAFFGETPDRATALGAAIIILSGIYVVFREETPHVSRTRPVLQSQTRFVSGTYPRISSLRRLFADRRTRRRPRS